MKVIEKEKNVKPGADLIAPAFYTVTGTPAPLARPRFFNNHAYDSQKSIKERVGWELKAQHDYPLPFEGSLKIEVTFFMPLPQRLHRRATIKMFPQHVHKPDLDNLIKMILDCANGIIFKDDALITCIVATKVYSLLPRTELTITSLEKDA